MLVYLIISVTRKQVTTVPSNSLTLSSVIVFFERCPLTHTSLRRGGGTINNSKPSCKSSTNRKVNYVMIPTRLMISFLVILWRSLIQVAVWKVFDGVLTALIKVLEVYGKET